MKLISKNFLKRQKTGSQKKPIELKPEPITAEEVARQQRAKEQGYTDWYHGTTHEIPQEGFSIERGNIENYLGKYPHFSSSPYDASVNYAGVGPDLRSRIEKRADELVDHIFDERGIEGDSAYKEAKKLAAEELKGPHEGAVIPASLRMKKPVNVTSEKPTWLDLGYTDYGDELGLHPSDMLQSLEKSLKELGREYGFDGERVLGALSELGHLDDGTRADKFYKSLRDELNGWGPVDPETGDNAVGHVASEVMKDLGFDGIIMDASKTFPRMDMKPGTLHAAVFEPGNIRSRFAKFDPEKTGQEGLLLGRGSTPMPRSPYDREEERKDRRHGGRVNKAGGGGAGWGSPFGLSMPQAPILEDAIDRVRMLRQRGVGSSPFEAMTGSGRTAYPRDNPIYKFHPTPEDFPEYDLEVVGGKPKKKGEDAIDRLNILSKTPMQDAQRFNRKFAPQDVSRFDRRRKNDGEVENVSPYNMFDPEAPYNYMVQRPMMDKLRDATKSFGSSYVSGMGDIAGTPRSLALIPNRLSGTEIVPESSISYLPRSEDAKKYLRDKIYGEGEKAYEPKTEWGKLSSSVGEISPWITLGTMMGGWRGGAAAALEHGTAKAITKGLGTGTKQGFKTSAPLALSYPIYSGFADGGSIPFGVRESAKSLSKAGLVNSASAGRADKVPGSVRAGSYVMPADVVSAMGQGNTMAGARALNSLMGMSPYGANAARAPRGRGMTAKKMKRFADGGHTDQDVEVNVSGGEFIFPPEAVEAIGGGDIDHGHEILDALAMQVRQKNVDHLTKLPPPRKD